MNKNIRAKMAYKYLVCAIIMAGAAACDKEGFEYQNEVETSGTQYLVTDTITMNVSTTYLDSVQTSNQGVALVGTNTDPYFGTISSSSYFKLKAYSGSSLANNAIYDSIVLMVHPTTYAYGDTTGSQGFEVYKVTEKIEKTFGNTGTFYNNSSYATDPTPLGSISIAHIRPHLDSVYSIKLDDAVGKEFFNQVYNKLPTITNQTQFSAWFPGLYIKPNANSSLITGLRADDSLTVRMYYHVNAATYEWKSVDFAMYQSNFQFNHVDFIRPSGSALSTLTPNAKLATNKLPAASAENMTYVQPLTHLVTRIELPYLKSFSQTAKFYKVMRATLTVRPIISSYLYPYTLPSKLTLVSLNDGNAITDSLTNPSSGGVQTGSLVTDFVYNLNTAYTYDVTNYVINQINSNNNTSRALGLITPGTTGLSKFERVVLGGPNHKSNPIELKIYYLLYN
jgi:hypothetical protein